MRKTETRTIGELEVTTQQLPSTRAYRLLPKVGKILAPALGAIRGKNAAQLMAMDIADLGPALEAFFEKIDDATADALMLEALACTSVTRTDEGGRLLKFDLTNKGMIDLAFDGDVKALLAAIKFALEVNFGGFFAGTGPSASESPAPSA